MTTRHIAVNSVVMTVSHCISALCALLLLCGGRGAEAQINFVFLPETMTASPGGQTTYAATVTNNGPNTVYINNDNITFDGPASVDDSPFVSAFTGPLAAGQSITNQGILTLTVDTTAAPNAYLGSFNILGGDSDSANNPLASQNFELVVAAVPECSSLQLLTLGLGGLAALCPLSFRRRLAKGC
jgi:hypothetical protein